MAETEKKNSKVFIGLYITFCVLFVTWLTTKFFRGRRQIHQAFDTIGIQLQRMQEQLDQRRDDEEERMLENSNSDGNGEKLSSVAEDEPEVVGSEFVKNECKAVEEECLLSKREIKPSKENSRSLKEGCKLSKKGRKLANEECKSANPISNHEDGKLKGE